jgi:hypothetical protein
MPYRILSLDGGGAWALIQVRTLMTLYGESTSGHEALRNFDLAAGNSGAASDPCRFHGWQPTDRSEGRQRGEAVVSQVFATTEFGFPQDHGRTSVEAELPDEPAKWKGIDATPEGDFFVRHGPGTVNLPPTAPWSM